MDGPQWTHGLENGLARTNNGLKRTGPQRITSNLSVGPRPFTSVVRLCFVRDSPFVRWGLFFPVLILEC